MPDLDALQARSVALFRRPPRTTAQLLADAAAPKTRFSVFDPRQQDTALNLASEFMRIAGDKPDPDSLQKVLDRVEQAFNQYPVEMVKYSLMVFITHSPGGMQLPIPSLEMREPEKARQNPITLGLGAKLMAAQPTEVDLNWLREDPLANEHHERWHVVYPARGIPDASGKRHTKKRQGELFVYMHQQMLARYDAERVAIGLGLVQPFAKYRDSIPYGYDPGPALGQYYSARPAGKGWSDLQGYPIMTQENVRTTLDNAIANKTFPNAGAGADSIGAAIEASVDGDPKYTGPVQAGLHNMGHGFFSMVGNPPMPGVMTDTATAIRDPVFFQWHRHIDDFGYRWQELQDPNNFADAPPVKIRKSLNGGDAANRSPDIIVCLKKDVPGSSAQDFDFAAFGKTSFGGDANWNKRPEDVLAVDRLITEMLDREYDYTDAETGALFHQKIRYLDQKEFLYFVRLENTSDAKQDVTVRIFLVPQVSADERRLWIEMDKFLYTLGPKEKAVAFRGAWESSVIRKPATKPPEFLPIRRSSDNAGSSITYCDCGWPYNLLLPKGLPGPAGMDFRLMVMVTDWSKDHVPAGSKCGSLSFCGSKQDYPDDRPMGYPFDRPFKAKNIADTIAAQDNMATRDIVIEST